MKTHLECLPCACRQALEAARFVTDDVAVQERVLRSILRTASEMDFRESPPALAVEIHSEIQRLTGNTDPYLAAKRLSNQVALELLPRLRDRFRDGDPLENAVRLAIAGNIIDLGPHPEIAGPGLSEKIEEAAERPFARDGIERFRQALSEAADILFLGDNAGEIVFDRLLLELLPCSRVTYVVKARPIINDATMEDAEAAGITRMVTVIDNGSGAPGTMLPLCSPEFHRRFDAADLILAKGQANYETLSGLERGNIFFLLMAKCAVIARDLGVPIHSLVLREHCHG